jgi:Flp pilus assembly protein TadD
MALFNDGKSAEAETLLKEAMRALRNAKLPMMQAKILNSLGLIYAQRNETPKARRCMSSSLRIIAGHVGTDNWLYSRITANRDRLAA